MTINLYICIKQFLELWAETQVAFVVDCNRGDAKYDGPITDLESLVHMKDPQMYKETKDAISRFHSVLGVRQKDIKLGNLGEGTLGVHLTSVGEGKSVGIVLNKKYFNHGKKAVIAQTKKGYESGWHTKTNKAAAHTVTHELAHATWNSYLKGTNQRAAGKVIDRLYNRWKRDEGKRGYGKYAHTNVNEFWAEVCTKAVHGTSDKYTREAKRIVKLYKL